VPCGSVLCHADGRQHRNIAYRAGTAALEHQTVQDDIGEIALDRPIVPGIGVLLALFVLRADGRGADLRAAPASGGV